MEMHQLKYFLIVSQEQSFARAARKTYVSQQALSKSIISLEQELGVSLFQRLHHGIQLTECGEILQKSAYSVISTMDTAVRDIHAVRDKLSHSIVLAVTIGATDDYPLADLFHFQDVYPQYHISTITDSDSEIEKLIRTEKIELGIVCNSDDKDLEFIHLGESTTFLAVHRSNPLANLSAVHMQDLKEQIFIGSSSDYYTDKKLTEACKAAGFTPDIRHRTVNINYIIQLLEYNQGIFLCPEKTMKIFNTEEVRLRPIIDDPKIFSLYLVYAKSKSLSKEAVCLRDYILNVFNTKEP